MSHYITNGDEDLNQTLTSVTPFMAQALPHFPRFDLDSDLTSIGSRWEKYICRFKNLLVALDVTDDARKKVLLLHYAGEKVHDVFETFQNMTKAHLQKRKKP